MNDASDATGASVKVWDPFVRIFHWTLAAGFFVAYFSEDLLIVHVWAGYLVGALVLLRIVWGFVGPRHARFVDFLFPPAVILGYLADLLRLRARRYLGHGPAGAVMVFVFLGGLLAVTGTGLVLDAEETRVGPLAGARAADAVEMVGAGLVAPARASEYEEEAPDRERYREREGEHREHEEEYAEHEDEDEALEEIHGALGDILLVFAFLHIGGVLWASLASGENLTRAMITGRKRPL